MELIYPMFLQVILTAVIGIASAYNRIKSAYAGDIDPRFFKLMANYEITDKVAKLGRSFDNQFEVPVLFYAACATALALSLESHALIVLAWLFVILRFIHAFIHLSYNNPLHRFVPFLLSFVCTVAMWTTIVVTVSV